MSLWRAALTRYALLLFLLVPASLLRAQGTTDLLGPAISAYTDLEYDQAADRLRSLLARTGTTRLSDGDRVRALMYLGATELFRGVRPAAVDAFRTLLLSNPRYRPDELIFPPEVVALFQETRIGVRAVGVEIAPESEIAIPTDQLPIRLYASSLHDIRVRVTRSLGAPERVLYEGVIGDSLLVSWDGRGANGEPGTAGQYLLRITSRSPSGDSERELQVPLDIAPILSDTVAWPAPLPPSTFRAETVVRENGVQQLLTGLAGAAAVVVLPSVAGANNPSTSRYAVAGAVSLAGVIGLATATRPRPVPENIAFNQARRAEWQQEVTRVQMENAARLRMVRLRVRAERPRTVEIR